MIFISEITSVNKELEVLKEVKENGRKKLRFRACLQTTDKVNANRRLYPKEDMSEALSSIKEMIQRRTFLGELDHPLEEDQKRQTQVLLKSASHVITKIWMSNNEIIGECETLRTPNGEILYSLIKDNVPIGFSLRALGNLESKENVAIVKKPIFIITYDAVSNPSHKEAVVREIITESLVCINGVCYNGLNPIEKLVEKTFEKEYKKIMGERNSKLIY